MRPDITLAIAATWLAAAAAHADQSCPSDQIYQLYQSLYAADSNGDTASAQNYANQMWSLTDASAPNCNARAFMQQSVAPSYPDPATKVEHVDVVMEVRRPTALVSQGGGSTGGKESSGKAAADDKVKMEMTRPVKPKAVLPKPDEAKVKLGVKAQ